MQTRLTSSLSRYWSDKEHDTWTPTIQGNHCTGQQCDKTSILISISGEKDLESVPGEICVRGDTIRVTTNKDDQVIERGAQLDVYELFILSGQQFRLFREQ